MYTKVMIYTYIANCLNLLGASNWAINNESKRERERETEAGGEAGTIRSRRVDSKGLFLGGKQQAMICATLSTPHGASFHSTRLMIYVIKQTNKQTNKTSAETATSWVSERVCTVAVLPSIFSIPIDKCATFCAIKEKIFRAINHQRRRTEKAKKRG